MGRDPQTLYLSPQDRRHPKKIPLGVLKGSLTPLGAPTAGLSRVPPAAGAPGHGKGKGGALSQKGLPYPKGAVLKGLPPSQKSPPPRPQKPLTYRLNFFSGGDLRSQPAHTTSPPLIATQPAAASPAPSRRRMKDEEEEDEEEGWR